MAQTREEREEQKHDGVYLTWAFVAGAFMVAGGGQNGAQGAQYVIDSGAGAHYAGTREAQRALVERRESHGWVVTASGDKYEYRECGTAYVRARNGGVVRIEDVKVMRGFAYDLISEGKLEEKGARIITGGGVKEITKEGRTILRLEKESDNLYRVPVARVSEEDHRRMKGTEPAMRVAEDPDEEY